MAPFTQMGHHPTAVPAQSLPGKPRSAGMPREREPRRRLEMEALHANFVPVTDTSDPRKPQTLPDRRAEAAQQPPLLWVHQFYPQELVFPIVGPPRLRGPPRQPILKGPNAPRGFDRPSPPHQPGADEPEGRWERAQPRQRRTDQDAHPAEAAAGPRPQDQGGVEPTPLHPPRDTPKLARA